MKLPILLLLLTLCKLSPAQNQTEINLLSDLSGAKSDSDKVKIYIDLHNLLFKTNLTKSEEYARLMLKHGKLSNTLLWENKGYLALARCARKRRQYDEVYKFDTLSLLCTQRSNNANAIFSAKMQFARDFLDDVKPAKAYPYIVECEMFCKRFPNIEQLASTEESWGWYYANINQRSKAVGYYEKAARHYLESDKKFKAVECKMLLVESLISIGRTDNVPELLFDALKFFRENNSLGRQAYCYGLLGQSYLVTGNTAKGLENYNEAIKLYKASNSDVEEALAVIDVARIYLLQKDFQKAESLAKEAETALNKAKFDYGTVLVKTFWGQFYSEKNNFQLSEQYFKQADKEAREQQLTDLETDNQRYWTQQRYKQKKYGEGDSLMIRYAQQVAKQKEPAMIATELKKLASENKITDSKKLELLTALYTPEQDDELKKLLEGTSLSKELGTDSLIMVNPFSLAPTTFDADINLKYNNQLLDVETKYKTALVSDSLQREKQNALIVNQQLKNRNVILTSVAAFTLLLFIGFALQYKNRKRAERDKAHIQMLQNEIHHRVKNNLGVIQRLVDVAGKNAVDDVPLSSLKTRIKSIELLHKHLYGNEAKPGNVSLQLYLQDVCGAIASTFESEKDISIKVNAQEEVSSHVAEKLGLIVNELVTNSYKYAFVNKDAGTITVNAKRLNERSIEIAVEDNGIGFEAAKNKGNYGMKLIKGLSHELNGKFTFNNSGGTHFNLSLTA